jgi:ribosome-binding protein aMBF1 (putative translation factor)
MIINNIKAKIKEAGYSLKWIAQQKLNIHHTELSNICAGRRKPKTKIIRSLSRFLRCKMTDLYEERN